jgi:hypothetical protein
MPDLSAGHDVFGTLQPDYNPAIARGGSADAGQC